MDPIADMLIRFKNAGSARKPSVFVPYSKMKFSIATLLAREGFLGGVTRRTRRGKKMLECMLRSGEGNSGIRGVRRLSKLSRRVYLGADGIRRVRQGFGRLVLSTPKGIMTGEEARKEHVGGEALFTIW
ncbi:MAG: 30S ribosomal protein S8 [bacterium]|nr:30S ribosomal protein S8 [bacterium]MDZ4285212.1 30S ribosomal protein S8 [Patescibacteria group bacterium]